MFMIRSILSALVAIPLAASAAFAGDLTPPPGPIQATDRTPINAQAITIPFTISEPGSYVLASDITGVGTVDTIIIAASDVTLDLNGFAIRGVTGSASGIELALNVENVAVRNGTITGHSAGIDASLSRNCRFEDLRLAENGSGLFSGLNATVTGCTAYLNQFQGISVGLGSTVENCTAQENGQFGFQCTVGPSSFRGCTATRNGSNGFSAITIEGASYADCVAYQNGLNGFETGAGATVENCTATENDGEGFSLSLESVVRGCTAKANGIDTADDGFDLGTGSVVSDSTAANNAGSGFRTGLTVRLTDCTSRNNAVRGFQCGSRNVLSGCTAEGNGADGFSGGAQMLFDRCVADGNTSAGIVAGQNTVVRGCIATLNGGIGISLSFGATVQDCSVAQNGDDGIQVSNDSLVQDNNCDGNGSAVTDGAGIRTTSGDCRIIGNNVTDNDIGIQTFFGCFVVQNSAASNGTNYSVSGTVGPIITSTGTITTTNPWANFSY